MLGRKYTKFVLLFSPVPGQHSGRVKNVTITLDEVTAGWARVHAAQRNVSLSRFVGDLLQQQMRESREYDEAMRRFLARRPVRLKREGERYPDREEVHDRPGLR